MQQYAYILVQFVLSMCMMLVALCNSFPCLEDTDPSAPGKNIKVETTDIHL